MYEEMGKSDKPELLVTSLFCKWLFPSFFVIHSEKYYTDKILSSPGTEREKKLHLLLSRSDL